MKMRSGPVKVSINFVDGSHREYEDRLSLLAMHDRVVDRGLNGKELIDALLSDDMQPPPERVVISFFAGGLPQKLLIPYR